MLHGNFLTEPLGSFPNCHGGQGTLRHREGELQADIPFANYTLLPPGTARRCTPSFRAGGKWS